MPIDRNDRDWRDQRRGRGSDDDRGAHSSRGDQSGGERGFFERSRDEISSWFGDDEAERRREMDERSGGSGRGDYRERDREQGRPYFSQDDRPAPRERDEGARRPYSGRSPERSELDRGNGPRRNADRDHEQGYRPMTGDYGRASAERYDRDPSGGARMGAGAASSGGAAAAHDRHYGEWRQRQIDEIDRDYDDYRREHQSKFESDFSNWRSTRQTKRQMLGSIKEQMEVCGSDDQPIGKVDKVRGDRVILTKNDSPDGQHHSVNCAMIDRVEGDRVILDKTAAEATSALGNEDRDRALGERDEQREPGAHILNRSFSGTY